MISCFCEVGTRKDAYGTITSEFQSYTCVLLCVCVKLCGNCVIYWYFGFDFLCGLKQTL